MERKSKTRIYFPLNPDNGGGSLRNQDVLNEDRISRLPEDLLMKILSSLPTHRVIATSVLSKSWRSLWKMVPNIKFSSENHKTSFSEIVYRCLLSSNYPFLESLYLVYENVYVASDIEIFTEMAFERHVRKLVLDVPFHNKYPGVYIRFPSRLCSCNNTLEMLELSDIFQLDFPSRVGLKSLKKLHLNYVSFKNGESVCNLLCGCPSLEDLVMYRHWNCDAAPFTIAVPSLQRLTIVDTFQGVRNGGYVINAPSLKYLTIRVGYKSHRNMFMIIGHWYGFCRIENAPELVEAKIIGFHDVPLHNENIVVSLTSAKRLSLDFSPLKIKFPTGIIFYQLVFLELQTSKKTWSNLLARMLDSSPKLQILKLIMDANEYDSKVNSYMMDREWEQPLKCVPEFLLFHLETLVWTRYVWDDEVDKEVATTTGILNVDNTQIPLFNYIMGVFTTFYYRKIYHVR